MAPTARRSPSKLHDGVSLDPRTNTTMPTIEPAKKRSSSRATRSPNMRPAASTTRPGCSAPITSTSATFVCFSAAKNSTTVKPKRTPAGAEDRIADHDKRRRARAQIASIPADPIHNRQNASSSAGTFAILTMTFDRAQATTATPTAPTPRRVARRPRGLVVSIARLSQPRAGPRRLRMCSPGVDQIGRVELHAVSVDAGGDWTLRRRSRLSATCHQRTSADPPGPADLIRVVVGMVRIDLQPCLHAIGAALRVRPTPRPLPFVEPVEDLGRRLPRRGDRLDRRLDRALTVEEALRVILLVVALNRRRVLSDQATQPDRRRHLAVRHVMNYLPSRPLIRPRTRIELTVGDPFKRLSKDASPLLVALDQLGARALFHRDPPNYPVESYTPAMGVCQRGTA